MFGAVYLAGWVAVPTLLMLSGRSGWLAGAVWVTFGVCGLTSHVGARWVLWVIPCATLGWVAVGRMMVFGALPEAAVRGIKGGMGRGARFLWVNPPEDGAARRLAGELLERGVEMTIRIGALRGSGSRRSFWASRLIGERPGAVEGLRGFG